MSFWRIASMSGSAKALSEVLTPFVFALVPLIALSSWAADFAGRALGAVAAIAAIVAAWDAEVKRTFDPSKLTPTVAGLPGPGW